MSRGKLNGCWGCDCGVVEEAVQSALNDMNAQVSRLNARREAEKTELLGSLKRHARAQLTRSVTLEWLEAHEQDLVGGQP
jgi:hypothetical protein